MKLAFLILIFISIGCKVSQNQSSLEIYQDKKYSVEKIDSVNNYYLIYLIQDNNKFKIVSKKGLENSTSCMEKIEVGQEYLLELQKLVPDRKSTRLNSSHVRISYAVFCLKKKKR